jgi:hypothetical protein
MNRESEGRGRSFPCSARPNACRTAARNLLALALLHRHAALLTVGAGSLDAPLSSWGANVSRDKLGRSAKCRPPVLLRSNPWRGKPQRSRWSEGRRPRGMWTSKARAGLRAGKRATGAGTHTATMCRHTPEVGAVCGKAARTELCGGRAMKRTSPPLHRRKLIPCSAAQWRYGRLALRVVNWARRSREKIKVKILLVPARSSGAPRPAHRVPSQRDRQQWLGLLVVCRPSIPRPIADPQSTGRQQASSRRGLPAASTIIAIGRPFIG